MPSNFRTCYKVTAIKRQHGIGRDRTEQRSEMSAQKHGQLTFEKGTQILQRGKDSLVNKWC